MTGRRSDSSRAGATPRQGPLFLLCLREQCIETVVDLLRRLGCPTEACHTLTDAQALLSDDGRNVVVIDMTAELAEAAACVAALREDHARSPIVVIECSNRPIVAAALLRSGADDVIGADCALIEVIARLKRFCS